MALIFFCIMNFRVNNAIYVHISIICEEMFNRGRLLMHFIISYLQKIECQYGTTTTNEMNLSCINLLEKFNAMRYM